MINTDILYGNIMHKTTDAERRRAWEYAKNNLIQITKNTGSNWVIFAERKNKGGYSLYSVAVPSCGASSSWFGDMAHLARLIVEGYKNIDDLTDAGRELLSGCYYIR